MLMTIETLEVVLEASKGKREIEEISKIVDSEKI